jgi:hypothetical protein
MRRVVYSYIRTDRRVEEARARANREHGRRSVPQAHKADSKVKVLQRSRYFTARHLARGTLLTVRLPILKRGTRFSEFVDEE